MIVKKSDGSDESIVNEYEGDEYDNGVEGDKDDMEDLLLYKDPSDFSLNENMCDAHFNVEHKEKQFVSSRRDKLYSKNNKLL